MKYIIYGLGVSGISCAKFLTKNKQDVICCDDNPQSLLNNSQKYPEIKFSEFESLIFDVNTTIIFAPGIPLYFPRAHKILEIVKKTGATLVCDIEAFYRQNSQKKFIGITGTNGKSTTTALSGFIFKELGIASDIGGNIGVPCFDLEQDKEDFTYIFEVSSFQLDLISNIRFGIAALLNITSDHIERHGSIENYIKVKKQIFKNQKEGDFTLINIDDKNSREVFLDLKKDGSFKSKLVPISTKEIQEGGVSLFNGKLTCNIKGKITTELKSEFLPGSHNDQNMAFAFATTYCYLQRFSKSEVNISQITKAIEKFPGLAHRMQIVGNVNNVRFINDSKATNAESCEKALKTYSNIFWIVGGKEKNGGISSLQPLFNKVVKAYLVGDSSDNFAKILEQNSVKFEKCKNLDEAFMKSAIDAENSGLSENNVLLSPACASFDQWKSFEQRGDHFCKLFDELSES